MCYWHFDNVRGEKKFKVGKINQIHTLAEVCLARLSLSLSLILAWHWYPTRRNILCKHIDLNFFCSWRYVHLPRATPSFIETTTSIETHNKKNNFSNQTVVNRKSTWRIFPIPCLMANVVCLNHPLSVLNIHPQITCRFTVFPPPTRHEFFYEKIFLLFFDALLVAVSLRQLAPEFSPGCLNSLWFQDSFPPLSLRRRLVTKLSSEALFYLILNIIMCFLIQLFLVHSSVYLLTPFNSSGECFSLRGWRWARSIMKLWFFLFFLPSRVVFNSTKVLVT